MGAMPDLTLKEIHEKCLNKEVKEYIDSMPELPFNINLCKLLATILETAGWIECATNNGTPAIRPEDKLDTYQFPEYGDRSVDDNNIHRFQEITYKLKVLVSEDKKDIQPTHGFYR
ncbi:MAG: hypothetical protein V7K67_06380 [Nostoc sp.]|uniref:hypothetical protein n=1 Tax=Nostoc sp. TaxID=1180 RepID=UPI002FF943F7